MVGLADLNQRPPHLQCGALPTELQSRGIPRQPDLSIKPSERLIQYGVAWVDTQGEGMGVYRE